MLLRLSWVSAVLLGLGSMSLAQVLGPSIQEVKFSYTAEFLTDDTFSSAEGLAKDHSQYIFGVFHSPFLTRKFGLNPTLVGGIGAPRNEMSFKILKFKTTSENRILVKYQVRGKLLLHKKVAAKALMTNLIEIPLPADLSQIYDKDCTDEYYDSFEDYWYFWDPLTNKKCQYLAKPPYSNPIQVSIQPAQTVSPDITPRLDLLRGDNGNGDDFSIYVIHGFAESATNQEDEGRENFSQLNIYLRKNGFEETIERKTQSRPLYLYRKAIALPSGKIIKVEIRHLLVDTGIESRSATFAKFFKEAVENADVIVYGGHSGLGGNLDIPSLEEKAGQFVFNKKKRQIFFFDSCASYSYYLGQFSAEKTKSKIDIVTNGLSSFFQTSQVILEGFIESLLSETTEDLKWLDILKAMETPLEGGSFLLNVGGV